MITLNEIKTFAETNDPGSFDMWCDTNGLLKYVSVTPFTDNVSVTLTNFNDGYYNVLLPGYRLNVMYYNGVLVEINENYNY